jgi:hypothetical protein
MGLVYLCYDTVAGEPIAIKTYRDVSASADGLDGGRGEALLARLFESEALIWIRLGRHPNVVEARYVVELSGKPHLFLELVGSPTGHERTLRHLIRAGRLEPARAIRLALQVSAGLEHALSIFPGLVHRDLKPENLLLAADEVVKVTDFGLTRVFADVTGRVATLAGTPAYMSPEQCLGLASLDTRSDIYSLGVILYEMVTGRRPFSGDLLQAHLTAPVPDPREGVPDLPESLAMTIGRCLAKRPEERYASFGALRAALSACHLEVTGRAPNLPEPAGQAPDQRVQAGIDLARAISLATLGHYDEAVGLLDRAVTLDPGYAEAWRWRGIGFNALGQLSEAARCFEQALTLAPDDVDAWLEQGRLRSRMGRRDEALASFDAALAVDPGHVAARYERGTTLFFLGRYDEAAVDLEQAYARQPGPALAAAVQACGRRAGRSTVLVHESGIDGLPSPASVQPIQRGNSTE